MTRVVYDGRWAGSFGIGRYSHEIRIRLADVIADFHAPGNPVSPGGFLAWECVTARVPSRHARQTMLFSPSFTPSLAWPGPQAITVHDLIHLDVPGESSYAKRAYYAGIVRPAVRRNAVTFTVSEFSKSRIVAWSGVEPNRVIVTGNAADEHFSPTGPRHAPGYPYVLYVRNAKPHKNSARLVEAFAELPDDGTRLVLSGEPDPSTQAAAATRGVSERVVFAGLIPEEQLPEYYRGAAAVAFPSLYEGFGIPAVEGMACAVPVVASNTTSLPEVVGDAAVLIDPTDHLSIAEGLNKALHDDGLRTRLATAGPLRAGRFSWESLADRVNRALTSVT